MSDTVYLEPDTIRSVFTAIPREPADSDPAWIKHVICEGARFHVLSYSTRGVHCSEPRCIWNKPRDDVREASAAKALGTPASAYKN